MKKLIAIAALAATVIATPALAQSYNPDFGTGNVLSSSNDATASRSAGIADRQSGLGSFAMVPQARSAANSNTPADTGGGSVGYDQELMIH